MRTSLVRGRLALAVMVSLGALQACGDGPTEPADDINPGLLEPSEGTGLATSNGVPQGSARFTGPDGMPMDATAEEFIQQLTWNDGTVWKTSGISVRAAADESVQSPTVDRLSFGSAYTGSLASVPPGTYTIDADWPDIDFIQKIKVTYAQVRQTGASQYTHADDGEVTIQSANYFDDVYTCELSLSAFVIDECTYQIGLVKGVVEFHATLEGGGEVVVDRTSFAIPIQRRTIIFHER